MGRRAQTLLVDVAPAVALAVFLVVVTPLAVDDDSGARALDPLAFVLLAFAGLMLAARRRRPVAAYALVTAITVAYFARQYGGGPIPLAPFGALLAVVAATGARVWVPAAVFGLGALAVAYGLAEGFSLAVPFFYSALLGGAALFAVSVALRRAREAEVLARATWAERTREQEASRRVAEERLRIAREVHDMVGHSLATIALQAAVAQRTLDRRPEDAREPVAAIRTMSRQALGELRALLGLLHGADGADSRAPIPGLRDIPQLVSAMHGNGVSVELEPELDGVAVPDVVGAAAYRIVQESLTNVLRHAGSGARARVRVCAEPGVVELEVLDDGRAAPPSPASGSGLGGMRERAEALGGRFEAEARADGGFRVWALLPWSRG